MSFELHYSMLDRAVHRLAFLSPAIQITAADIEKAVYGKQFRHIPIERPIFLTSLPRAGTTLLLEILNRVPAVVTHCYRDMPFVLAPLLWEGVTGRFRKLSSPIERAHGDGMAVGYDSPEAFEEILWRFFWPDKYERDRIDVWGENDASEDFHIFFVEHMQKIIALRSGKDDPPGRYASKNNANIARIGLLRRMFPDGSILVPFRDPVEQASSLLRQHTKFLELHRREPFSKRYMDDIGHLEFGELHRPIFFDGLDDVCRRYRPDTLTYWVAYWVRAFEQILERRSAVVLVSYERLCTGGVESLRSVFEALDLSDEGSCEAFGSDLRAPNVSQRDTEVEDGALLDQAHAVHARLLDLSVV